jgi:hypothetical protein
MMAAQRIKANLCKEEPKRSSFTHLNQTITKEHKPIPGWTDGTNGWRAEVYSFAKPRDHSLPANESEDPKHAYKGFVTSSQRQGGVYSTLDLKYQVPQLLSEEPMSIPHNNTVDVLYSKYNLAFTRRSESRSSMLSSSSVLSMARSLPTTVTLIVKKKEAPIFIVGPSMSLFFYYIHFFVSLIPLSGCRAPTILAPLWIEGSLVKFFPQYSFDKVSLKNLIAGFSTPKGFPSHINAKAPGSIHKGGELGYMLAVTFSAAMDKPELIVPVIIGNGEAETRPTAV